MVIFIIIFSFLFILYGLLIHYYRTAWNAIPEYTGTQAATVKISVIVAVRNEEKNITALLNSLFNQDYPKSLFEVIIINDHSTDHTGQIVNDFISFDKSNLLFINLKENITSKKSAIKEGINNATGELIVTTDADCTMKVSWLSTIASYYRSTNAQFIAAPVLMDTSKTFIGIFQSLDFLTLQGITGASVFRRFHTMCNGANLAYTKKAFEEVNGFEGIDSIPSGDDMLLMHKIYARYPQQVHYLKSKLAFVSTRPEASWRGFLHQRIRWASKSAHYKDRRIFYILLLTYLINAGMFLLAVVSFIGPNGLAMVLLFLLAKILIEFPFVNAVAIYFNQNKLMRWFPLLQPVHIIYILVAGWLGKFGSYKWKSRTVKT
ncbi:MAG: glycosyltransferase [Flavitalea sp.]